MRKRIEAGFTLVEILIVVVILGILAAIVVPQFTNASNEAIKGALESQLQTINSQVELFRVRNAGAYPDFSSGWGDLVTDEYLKEEPINGYTGQSVIAAGNAAAAAAMTRTSANGWTFDAANNHQVHAAGYDEATGLLEHE
jgi:prepilin-type N-terminal cleavage/methylation domain-containing protein